MTLPVTYSLEEVAEAVGMSTRWVRDRCKDGAPHSRMGHKLKFTEEQVAELIAAYAVTPSSQSITTGRKRRS